MDAMKDSGIKWIGEIPSSWKLIRMKDCSYMKGRIGWQGLTADEFIEEGPYLVTGTDFDSGHVCWDRSYHVSEKRYEEAPEIQLRIGDLLVTKDGTIGKLALIDELPGKACLNSHLLVIRPLYNQYVNRYLYWVLNSPVFQGYYEQMSYGSTMNSLSQENIGDFHFFVPSITEQERIADYLDKHCAKLDKIIANLERQIELLQKYKKSLITETVTKGLDKNVEMKDSGIPWIGNIPKHWEIRRGKYIFKIYGGSIKDEDLSDSEISGWREINYFKVDDMNRTENGFEMVYDNEKLFTRKSYVPYTAPLILIPKRGAAIYTNKVRITHEDCLLDPNIMGLRTSEQIEYYAYLLFARSLTDIGDISTIPQINNKHIDNLKLPVPSIEEQRDIVTFLNKKCELLGRISLIKEEQLKAMQKHKASLIYEYVTGKKRVKEVV